MADEYIRRDDFIQYLEKCKKGAAVTNLVWAAIMAIERDVRDMPAADVAPVVLGRWIDKTEWIGSFGQVRTECSICGTIYPHKPGSRGDCKGGKFCEECGARMDGAK